MEKPVKIVAVDLDGTFLYNTRKVTERNLKAIRELRKRGIRFGICSGRSAIALQKMVKIWGIENDVDFVLGFNGAQYWDPKTGVVEETHPLDADGVREIFQATQGEPFIFGEYQGKTFEATRFNILTGAIAKRNELEQKVVTPKELEKSTLKLMAVAWPWTLNKWLKSDRENQLQEARVFRSGPFLLEFVHKGLSKLEGVKKAAEKYGADMDEIVTFGNDNNDLEMLAGTQGVAMANALPAVKAAAPYTTLSNKQDGVADFIEKYILNDAIPPKNPAYKPVDKAV